MRIRIRLLALVAVLATAGSACSRADNADSPYLGAFDQSEEAISTTAAPATTIPVSATEDRDRAGSSIDAPTAPPIPSDLGRSIIYTATIEVEVDDVIAAGTAAQQAIAPLGGLLFGQETSTGPDSRSVLTIKVRPEDFQEALDRLSGIGTLVSQTISADDVTERVVDLQSRITTAEASVERLRTFLSQATDLRDVASLEEELLRRETDLELLRGQLRTVETQVDLATITLILTEPTPEPALELIQTAYLGHDGGQGCPGGRDLTLDEGDAVTFCYQITNVGDTDLADVAVRDAGVDARFEDMILIYGDPAATLAPGERLLFAFETTADPRVFSNPAATATAIDRDESPLRESVTTSTETASVSVAEDTSLPGFSDALRSSWHGVQRVVGVVVVTAGAIVPFLWLPVLALAVLWVVRRKGRSRGITASDEQ